MTAQQQRGAILPVVLWVVMICLVAAGSYTANVKLAIATATNNQDVVKMRQTARAGIYAALQQVLDQGNQYGSASQRQASDLQIVMNDLNVHVRMAHEGNKLALNQAGHRQLSQFLTAQGIEQHKADQLAARIVDWRDSNKLRLNLGMEDEDYVAAGYSFGAKDSFYNDMEELRLVAGMTKQAYRLLQTGFTLYPAASGRVLNLYAAVKNKQGRTLYSINSMVHLTFNPAKPYRFLKWSQTAGEGV